MAGGTSSRADCIWRVDRTERDEHINNLKRATLKAFLAFQDRMISQNSHPDTDNTSVVAYVNMQGDCVQVFVPVDTRDFVLDGNPQ